MARPSKYNTELQKKFDDLVNVIADIDITTGQKRKEQITRLIEEFFTYGDINSLALYLGIVRDTIYDWTDKKSDRYNQTFSYTLKRWDTKRRALLFKITPFIDKTLAIFFNKCINGYLEVHGVNLKTEETVNHEVKIYLPENNRTVDKKELNRMREMVKPKTN